MARLSKSQSFTIHEDAGIPTPDTFQHPSFEEAVNSAYDIDTLDTEQRIDRRAVETDEDDVFSHKETNNADDGARRASFLTQTSISSFPRSNRDDVKPYKPPVIRPSFRRPESVRRLQLSSPPPFRSPRHSVVRHTSSRSGTPRSARSARAHGSPLPRRTFAHDGEDAAEAKNYPLVLLHITLLPTTFPWSRGAVHDLLPADIAQRLQLLRTKVTDTLLQRGLLIPHPHAEYDLLEERLLEALELRSERITKCGHFRSDSFSSGEGSDSGLGSSVDGSCVDSDENLCATCQQPLGESQHGAGESGRKWSIKVYAANGLLGAGAWAAAWDEMESVDVEILPWVSDELRRELDIRTYEDTTHVEQNGPFAAEGFADVESPSTTEPSRPTSSSDDSKTPKKVLPTELPQIYRRAEIPITILLRNYVFLLAKDRRNATIFFLAMFAFCLGVRSLTGITKLATLPTQMAGPWQANDTLTMAVTAGSVEYTSGLTEQPTSSATGSPFVEIDPGGGEQAAEDDVERLNALLEPELHLHGIVAGQE
ncbi:hypothetical protein BAUCODRAFT_38102 [Baudoinia panamericana UAMH 10762]|uniref:Uncharacterized protein n=1 Tax=Baudoinia panamericana (strain UAMH 10762) TaxID=717646 RepID=M2MZH3_BAUPA|nr:uncharacterized protein BAUCODRAFT_38102 [Baudoinia panamericana UAMH 10762]EMC92074.1 hypothetical protein BAUCODRAFT_38102 [Baudoinia panamericana UAMH 10762]